MRRNERKGKKGVKGKVVMERWLDRKDEQVGTQTEQKHNCITLWDETKLGKAKQNRT